MSVKFSRYPGQFGGIKTEINDVEVPEVCNIDVHIPADGYPEVTIDISVGDKLEPFELEDAHVVIHRHDMIAYDLLVEVRDNTTPLTDAGAIRLDKIKIFLKSRGR